MDVTVILIVVAAWIALAAVVALVYGRVVARADHDRAMGALHHEVWAKDGASRAAAAPSAMRVRPPAPRS